MLKSELDKTEFEVPSLSFVTKKARMIQKNVDVFAKRHGKRAAKEKLPYQPLKVPERKNVQWQIDGWDLPFWMAGNGNKLERWVLVRVIDVCSRKILGWVTCEKENTVSIMQTLENAVTNTGVIPVEIIMDKHTATKTDTFGHFKATAERLYGMKIEISILPTAKAIIERQNGYFNTLLKHYPEWLGEGLSGKNPKLRNPESRRELAKTKNHVEVDELKARIEIMIHDFNNMPLKPLEGKTPTTVYGTVENAGIELRSEKITQLFRPSQRLLVRRGMITISIGRKNTYTLPSSLYETYNDTYVNVHTFDFDEEIYVFADDNETHIINLKPDNAISNSLTERLKTDKPKGLGVAKGAQKKAEREQSIISNPENLQYVDKMQFNKSALQQIRSNDEYRQAVTIAGIDTNKLKYKAPEIDENDNETMELETDSPYKRKRD